MIAFDHFTAWSSLLPYAFVWAPYICMGKMLRILNNSSEAPGPMLLKFFWESPWGRGMVNAKMVGRC